MELIIPKLYFHISMVSPLLLYFLGERRHYPV